MNKQQWGVTVLCAMMVLGAGSLEAAKQAVLYETEIDYISIDIEGGELNVLKSIDFDKYLINIFLE